MRAVNCLLCVISFICIFSYSLRAQNNCPTWQWADSLSQTGLQIFTTTGDSIGNFYVAGLLQDTLVFATDTLIPTGNRDYFVARYDTARSWSWGLQFQADEGTGTISHKGPSGLYFDHAGYLSITGNFGNSVSFDTISIISPISNTQHAYVAKLDVANQEWQWAKQITSSSFIGTSSIETDNSGSIYVCGGMTAQSGLNDTLSFGSLNLLTDTNSAFILKISPSGMGEWVKLWGHNYSSFINPGLTITGNGTAIVAGSFEDEIFFNGQRINSTPGLKNMALIAYDSAGQGIWHKTVTSSDLNTGIKSISSDNGGNVYLIGDFSGAIHFNQDTLTTYRPGDYIAKCSPTGSWLWANQWCTQTIGNDRSYTVSSSKNGNHYVSGDFSGTLQFSADLLKGQGSSNIFVAKVDNNGSADWWGKAFSESYNTFNSDIVGVAGNSREEVYIMGSSGGKWHFGLHSVQISSHFSAKIIQEQSISLTAGKDTSLPCGASLPLDPKSSSAAHLHYNWSPGVGLSDSTVRKPVAFPDSTITYTLSVQTPTGCTATDQITIQVDSVYTDTTGILTTSTGGGIYCDNNNNFSISAPSYLHSYLWNTGDTTETIYPHGPGTYKVIAGDTNGCYVQDSLLLTAPARIAASNLLLCADDSVSLYINPSGLDSIRWSTGTQDTQLYAKQPGTYWATLYKDSCQYTDTVQVTAFTDTANASFTYAQNALTVNFQPSSAGILNGTWDFGDGSNLVNALDTSYTYASPGTYQVCLEATDVCGYTARECDSIKVGGIGLPEPKKVPQISFYPNPTTGILHIEDDEPRQHLIQIMDLSGKSIFSRQLQKGRQWKLDLQHLPKGYYVIKLDGDASNLLKL